MDVLILSSFHDLHAAVVHATLTKRGRDVRLWDLGRFGADRRGSISISDGEDEQLALPIASATTAVPSTVWARRLAFPQAGEAIHASDVRHVEQENAFFIQATWWALTRESVWVNPYTSRRFAKNKINQLRAAKASGFLIPPTLYSNDPARIRAFSLAMGRTIYKPHRISQFEESSGSYLLHTSVFVADRFSDEELSVCPGVFQRHVEKAWELRIHVMGEFVIAAKIHSQALDEANLDWRDVDFRSLTIEPVQLPEDIEQAAKATVKSLGLCFGIIDLIVTPDGDHVFLEVNEMGQFLWVERACPDLMILDHFCSFLMAPQGYRGNRDTAPVTYADILAQHGFLENFENGKLDNLQPNYEVQWIDVLV